MNRLAHIQRWFWQRDGLARQWRSLSLLAVAGLVVLALSLSVWSARAAIQLAYFVVFPTTTDVTLQWETLAEYDLSGFEILCKQEDELDSAYHKIGEEPACGGPQQGATYVFPITSGLAEGVSYCFRLREIAITGEPGEIFDRCGYGLGIAPTPAVSQPLTDTTASRATEVALRITATSVAAANVATAVANTNATVEAIRLSAPLSATLATSLTLTAQALLTTTAPISDTPTPVALDATGQTPFSQTLTAEAALAIAGQLPFSQTLTAQATLAAGFPPTDTPTPVADSPILPADTPTVDPNLALTPSPSAPTATVTLTGPNLPLLDAPATADPALAAQDGQPIAAAEVGAPPPAYVVQTFTPAAPPTALAPTTTPWPTATPTPASLLLASLMQPTTENLTLMLLCLTFFTAGGLGVLGLITSALYMRSRRDR